MSRLRSAAFSSRLRGRAMLLLAAAIGWFNPARGLALATSPVVVYDTLEEVDHGGQGFASGSEIGQIVTLAGSARQVVSFVAFLGDNRGEMFRLKFYALDGPGAAPLTSFWQSAWQTYPWEAPYFNRKHIAIAVPSVVVPDRFAWMIEERRPGADSSILMVATTARNVGTPGAAWQRYYPSGQLRRDNFQFVYGARILAIPEPASGILGAGLMLGLWGLRRSESSVPHASRRIATARRTKDRFMDPQPAARS